MKANIYIFILLAGFAKTFGQSITIESSDMPIPTVPYQLYGTQNTGVAPSGGIGQTLDYSNLNNAEPNELIYNEETISDFTDAGIDVYRSTTKSFNNNFSFYVDIEYDFNDNGVYEKGIFLPEQRYSLAPFTNNTSDSLIIENQGYLFSDPTTYIKFPFTHQSSWSSNNRRGMEFKLTVSAFGLNKIPAQMIWHNIRKDTIIGSGTLKIYTPSGPSQSYDVLIDQITHYSIDSFFVAGNPAPLALLNGFGISQGQKTNQNNRINIYRKGLFLYFASFFYGSKTFAQNPTDQYVCTNDVELLSATNNVNEQRYAALIFPNPSVQNEVHIKLIDKILPNDIHISLSDMSGRTQTLTQYTMTKNQIDVSIGNQIVNGEYVITVTDSHFQPIISDKIQIIR